MKNISLKYKIMILLTLVPLLVLGAYLTLVINTFEDDKVAYIFDSNSALVKSLGAQVHSELVTVLSSVRPMMQEFFVENSFKVLSKEIIKSDPALLLVGEVIEVNGQLKLAEHVKKGPEYLSNVNEIIPTMLEEIRSLQTEGHVLKAPFKSSDLVLLETIQNSVDKKWHHFLVLFRNPDITGIFGQESNRQFVLATEKGEILFQSASRGDGSDGASLLSSAFFEKLRGQNASDGIETIKSNKITWLSSYHKIGFSELVVISLINKKGAMGAIRMLIIKSLLFAGFLLFFTLFVSVVGSQSVTNALRDLYLATQRIAHGDFHIKVPVKSNDEIGSLAQSFNLMSNEVLRLLKETHEKARMEGELKTAKTVQETLFPQASIEFPGLKLAGFYLPASECGGDWWYHTQFNGKIFFCIGDATGHGAPAALITSAARSAASVIEHFDLNAQTVMALLNKAIYDVSKGRVNMTFFMGIYEPETGSLTYCNASHEPPFLIKGAKAGKLVRRDLIPLHDVNSPRLGESPDTTFESAQIVLESGDFVLFYTDGIQDLQSPKLESLGERNFLKYIMESKMNSKNPDEFIKTFQSHLDKFRVNQPLIDDVTYFYIQKNAA